MPGEIRQKYATVKRPDQPFLIPEFPAPRLRMWRYGAPDEFSRTITWFLANRALQTDFQRLIALESSYSCSFQCRGGFMLR